MMSSLSKFTQIRCLAVARLPPKCALRVQSCGAIAALGESAYLRWNAEGAHKGDNGNLLEAEESRDKVHPRRANVKKKKSRGRLHRVNGLIYQCPWCELGRTSDGGCKTERGAPSLAESKDVPRRT